MTRAKQIKKKRINEEQVSPAAAAAAAAAAAGYCHKVGGHAAAAAAVAAFAALAAAPMLPRVEFRLEFRLEFKLEPSAAFNEGARAPEGMARWAGRSSPPGPPQCTRVAPPTAMAVLEPNNRPNQIYFPFDIKIKRAEHLLRYAAIVNALHVTWPTQSPQCTREDVF